MPRNVRNFWIDADIDGARTRLSGGPQSKDGGFRLTVKQRANGCVTDALTITGTAQSDGGLNLVVLDADGRPVHRLFTARD